MPLWTKAALVLCMATLAGCAGGKRGGSTDGGPGRCDSDDDCNDGIDCTVDSCGVGGSCSFNPVDALCGDGESCSVSRGCSTSSDCSSDDECDDEIDCTVDSCGVDMSCRHMPLNELCEAGQECDPTMGCVTGSGCTSDADCDDEIDCTLDSCTVDMTCRHMPIDETCADGEVCNETIGCYTPMPCDTAEDCQDGNFCNGAEVCMPEFGCAPAPSPRMCDDSDDCTIDTCDTDADMCVFACDDSRSECGCTTVETPCEGTFAISPSPMQTCAEGQVDYHVTEAEFSCVGDVLSVSLGVPSETLDSALTQMPRPTDSTFDVQTVVAAGSGGCTETYRLTGRFTDGDTFTATFSATFTPALCALICSNQSIAVTGTRIP